MTTATLRRLLVAVLPAVVTVSAAVVAHGQSKAGDTPMAGPKVGPAPLPPAAAAQVPTVAASKSQILKPAVVERAIAGRHAVVNDGAVSAAVVSMNDGQPISCGDPVRFRARVTGGTRTPGTQVIAFSRIVRAAGLAGIPSLADLPRRLAAGELTQDEVGGTVFVGPGETKEVVFTTDWRACAPLTRETASNNVNQEIFLAVLVPAQPPGADPVLPRIHGFGIGAVTYRPLP
ncbi:MAG: hypothetical protein JNL38_36720 [Myxococcales bacterium]|nr:hypothetical protein [Myxococcales bacterium]